MSRLVALTAVWLGVGVCYAHSPALDAFASTVPGAPMAHSISLAPYTIEVRAKYKTEASPLKFLPGEHPATLHGDLLGLLQQLRTTGATRADEQQVLKVSTLKHDQTDIWGIVERGEYGSEARIVNATTHQQTHLQSSGEARLGRYYFRLHLPNTATTGLLILQRTGRDGAYTTLHRQFEDGFKEKRENFRLHFARAVHPELLKAMMEGKIYGFTVVTYKPSKDITDWVRRKGATKNVGEITISATATADKALWGINDVPGWYKKVLKDNATIADVFPNETIKSFKLVTEYNGQQRTFDLTDPEDIFPYQNITSEVVFGTDGHPTFDSIDEAAIKTRDELSVKLGMSIQDESEP